MQNVILTLATTKRTSEHDVTFWVCTLRDVKSGKEMLFGGYFEGPLSRQAAMNCALIESVRKLKKPVSITVCTSQGHGARYFEEALKDTCNKRHKFIFEKAVDMRALKVYLAESVKVFDESNQTPDLTLISHNDFDEVA